MNRPPTRREYLRSSPSPLAINLMLFIDRHESARFSPKGAHLRPYYWQLPAAPDGGEAMTFTLGGNADARTLTHAGVQPQALRVA